jgi:hypothetical protein
MQTEPKTNSPAALWSTLVTRLVAYHPTLNNLSDIRRAQLVMIFSLIIELVCIISSIGAFLMRRKLDSIVAILFSIGLLCFVVYGTGRTQYYKWGAWLIVIVMAGAGYLLFAWSTSPTPVIDLFIMLPMALVMAAGLLSVREQVAFLLSNVILVSILPFFTTRVANAVQYAGIFLSLGVLLLIVSAFRSRLEHDQFLELNRANDELRAVQDALEERVQLRTQAAEAARAETDAALYASREQAWFLNAQVNLAEALRSEQDLPTLTNRTMQALCSQLQSPIGAFFLFVDNQLKFTGGYAYLPNEQNPLSFQLGEGLVGQVAAERQKIFVKNIPTGYFEIVSGLGNALPSQLAILPCIYNQQLVGVIELGLLSGLSQANLQFLDAALESISIAFQNNLTHLRISELLAETQTQTEELQSREEELRAINEELEAQAESLRQVSDRTS